MASLVELRKALGPYANSSERAAWRRPRFAASNEAERELLGRAKPGGAAAAMRTIRLRELRRAPRLP